MDVKDEQIIQFLLKDAKLTSSQISNKTGIPITTIHNRIKRLEKNGIIKNYTVNLDYAKLGKKMSAYILAQFDYSSVYQKKIKMQDVVRELVKHEGILDASLVTGQHDLIIRVRVGTMEDLNKLITGYLNLQEGIGHTRTLMIMEEF